MAALVLFCFVLFLQCPFPFFALIFVLFVADDLPIWGKSHKIYSYSHRCTIIQYTISISYKITIYIKVLKFTCGLVSDYKVSILFAMISLTWGYL